jgi:hypothetical protein
MKSTVSHGVYGVSSAGFMLGLLLGCEGGGDGLLQNVWYSKLHDITTQKNILFTVVTYQLH